MTYLNYFRPCARGKKERGLNLQESYTRQTFIWRFPLGIEVTLGCQDAGVTDKTAEVQ